jgi:DNA-binding transcriptional LysR family regulator
MNPTLRQMRAFVALAKTGNFTLAAACCSPRSPA